MYYGRANKRAGVLPLSDPSPPPQYGSGARSRPGQPTPAAVSPRALSAEPGRPAPRKRRRNHAESVRALTQLQRRRFIPAARPAPFAPAQHRDWRNNDDAGELVRLGSGRGGAALPGMRQPLRRCALCEQSFAASALPCRVSCRAVLELRADWGVGAERRPWRASRLYDTVRVCRFCGQFFNVYPTPFEELAPCVHGPGDLVPATQRAVAPPEARSPKTRKQPPERPQSAPAALLPAGEPESSPRPAAEQGAHAGLASVGMPPKLSIRSSFCGAAVGWAGEGASDASSLRSERGPTGEAVSRSRMGSVCTIRGQQFVLQTDEELIRTIAQPEPQKDPRWAPLPAGLRRSDEAAPLSGWSGKAHRVLHPGARVRALVGSSQCELKDPQSPSMWDPGDLGVVAVVECGVCGVLLDAGWRCYVPIKAVVSEDGSEPTVASALKRRRGRRVPVTHSCAGAVFELVCAGPLPVAAQSAAQLLATSQLTSLLTGSREGSVRLDETVSTIAPQQEPAPAPTPAAPPQAAAAAGRQPAVGEVTMLMGTEEAPAEPEVPPPLVAAWAAATVVAAVAPTPWSLAPAAVVLVIILSSAHAAVAQAHTAASALKRQGEAAGMKTRILQDPADPPGPSVVWNLAGTSEDADAGPPHLLLVLLCPPGQTQGAVSLSPQCERTVPALVRPIAPQCASVTVVTGCPVPGTAAGGPRLRVAAPTVYCGLASPAWEVAAALRCAVELQSGLWASGLGACLARRLGDSGYRGAGSLLCDVPLAPSGIGVRPPASPPTDARSPPLSPADVSASEAVVSPPAAPLPGAGDAPAADPGAPPLAHLPLSVTVGAPMSTAAVGLEAALLALQCRAPPGVSVAARPPAVGCIWAISFAGGVAEIRSRLPALSAAVRRRCGECLLTPHGIPPLRGAAGALQQESLLVVESPDSDGRDALAAALEAEELRALCGVPVRNVLHLQNVRVTAQGKRRKGEPAAEPADPAAADAFASTLVRHAAAARPVAGTQGARLLSAQGLVVVLSAHPSEAWDRRTAEAAAAAGPVLRSYTCTPPISSKKLLGRLRALWPPGGLELVGVRRCGLAGSVPQRAADALDEGTYVAVYEQGAPQ